MSSAVTLALLAKALVTVQVLLAAAIFAKLSQYNKTYRKRFEEAEKAWSAPRNGLFEKPKDKGMNPFLNLTWRLTEYEKIKLSLMSVTMFPLRFVMAMSTFLNAAFWAFVFMKVGQKRLAKWTVVNSCQVLLFWFGFYRIRIKGKQAAGVGAIVSSHHSVFDGLVWLAVAGPRIFAEASNFSHPVMQVVAQALDLVLFDRSGQESRNAARKLMSSEAAKAVAGEASPILVFPQGTITNNRAVISFKDGAFDPGLPVQPAILRYTANHCDLTWAFSGPELPFLLFRAICQFRNQVEVEFLPIYSPSEEEKQCSRNFAKNVQLRMAKAMGVPILQHSLEDLQLQVAAIKANLPPETGIIGFSDLRDGFSADQKQIKSYLHVFKQMDGTGTGRVSFEEFVDCFRRGFHEPSPSQAELLRHFFDLCSGGDDTMDFRTFLVGLVLVPSEDQVSAKSHDQSPARNPKESFEKAKEKHREQVYASLAFAAFAVEQDDRISWQEFKNLWSWLFPTDDPRIRSPSKQATDPEPRPGSETRWGEGLDSELALCGRKIFSDICGNPSGEEVLFQDFMSYAERYPEFETRLRKSFFDRMASVLAPS